MNRIAKTLLAAAITCLAGNARAHDAWVQPGRGPLYPVYYGHKTPEAYPVTKITSLKVLNAAQDEIRYTRIETKEGLSINISKGKPAMFVLDFDNGYWVKAGNESKNVRLSQMPAGTDPVHPMKYSKTILSWQPWMAKPMGQRIEFVPVGVIRKPKAGAMLKMQLLLDGKPLAGQMVENNSDEKGPKTDKHGMVTVTVLKGINRFATDHNIMQDTDPDAKRLSLTAALVFIAD